MKDDIKTRLFYTLNNTSFVVVVADSKGEVVFVNSFTQTRTGFKNDEVINHRPGELWGGHMSSSYYKNIWHNLNKGKLQVALFDNKTKCGIPYSEYGYIAPIKSSANRIQYFIELNPIDRDRVEEAESFAKKFQMFFLKSKPLSTVEFLQWFFSDNISGFDVPLHEALAETARLFSLDVRRSEDKKLVKCCQQDHRQFFKLYNRYKPIIFRFFRMRLGGYEIAEDLTEETFARAFAHLNSFQFRNSLYSAYLLRVAHNLYVNYIRHFHADLSLDECSPDLASTPSTALRDAEASEVRTAVNKLPVADLEIVRSRYVEDRPIRAIASKFHISENAVKIRLLRARRKIAKIL